MLDQGFGSLAIEDEIDIFLVEIILAGGILNIQGFCDEDCEFLFSLAKGAISGTDKVYGCCC